MILVFVMIFLLGASVGITVYKKNKNKELEVLSSVLKETAIELDAKDPYFNGHTKRVIEGAIKIAKEIGLKKKDITEIELSGYLSEIGKIRIPEKILLKRDKLTEEEYNIIKKHPVIAYKMIENVKELNKVGKIVRAHHERYDGTGYPDGLEGDYIPVGARILSLVDAYDAMISDRPYKEKMTEVEVISELEKGKGKQFDPKLVDIYLEILKKS
ncbi:HD-GYP domain-containing protein [Haliovirga abyssi]|uniref:HD-GYP domain-containing protein n=1 Tax=Haliovirga abyssi TaxID=2996794 RepID=A0AAU9D2K8_9FUSO|nr:HD-GYP domain-containing protein [Haliovirga abyssi]BDU50231.1 hypothetical protein HLVA_08000 [Haliovirga abyssi]